MINKFLLSLFLISSSLFSQIDNNLQNDSFFGIIKSDALLSFDASLNTAASPLYFNQQDLLMMGAVIGLTSAAFTFDESVRTSVSNSQSLPMDNITSVAEKFGNAKYGTVLSGALYLGGHIFKDKYVRETGQILAEAMLVNGLYTMLLKISLGRARPYMNESRSEFDPFEFEFEDDENSFPSGHTSTAFTIATVLSERIDNIYASIGLYSLASLTAYHRIYSDVHWLSDTVLGAALGTFIGLKVVNLHNSYSNKKDGFNLKIFPRVSSRSYGVSFALVF